MYAQKCGPAGVSVQNGDCEGLSRADGWMYAGRVVLGCWSRGPQQALCVGERLFSSQRTQQACSLWAAPFIINAEVVWLGRLKEHAFLP
jgi:hypothetical protein